MDLQTLQTFLGWCLVLNYGILLGWAAATLSGDWVDRIHMRITGLDRDTVKALHFRLMGEFKLLVFVFNLAPWLALVIMRG